MADYTDYRLTDWLPTNRKEADLRGWDELDVVLFSADAYVDHPSFGAAVIGRILEVVGLKVAIVPISRRWDALDCFSALHRDAWTLWSTNIRPTKD